MREHTEKGTDPFTHSAEIRSGHTEMKVHEKLDPSKKNKAGRNIRESFDSDTHPESHPVAVIFDVTGSMASVPRIFVEKLGTLMATLVKKDFLQHPHILFGAVGDATVWIDAETHLRSHGDQIFDLTKVRAFLTAARPFIK
jgi:hypothetical protein